MELLFSLTSVASPQAPLQARVSPGVIATTDGEMDDRCSMVRFLLYANERDVEGLIHSSSRFHWLGHTWSGVEWTNGQLDQYAGIYPHLREQRHAAESTDAPVWVRERAAHSINAARSVRTVPELGTLPA